MHLKLFVSRLLSFDAVASSDHWNGYDIRKGSSIEEKKGEEPPHQLRYGANPGEVLEVRPWCSFTRFH